jgi:preprotein translocase subunit SecG
MYWTNAAIDILLVCYVIVCLLMCLVVLMQRSKQEGLGAAFGGGFTDSVWGAQTSQVLVKATVWFAALFFVLSICLARLYSHRASVEKELSPIQQELLRPVAPAKTAPVPAAQPAPVAPAAITPPTNAAPAK